MFSTFVADEALGAISLITGALAVMMAYTTVPLDVYLRKKMKTIINSFHHFPFRIKLILRGLMATTYHTVTVVFSVWILQGLDA